MKAGKRCKQNCGIGLEGRWKEHRETADEKEPGLTSSTQGCGAGKVDAEPLPCPGSQTGSGRGGTKSPRQDVAVTENYSIGPKSV